MADGGGAAAPPGNTAKAMFDASTMTPGLYFVILLNVLVTWLGLLFYRYVVLRQAGLLSPRELALLRKYPPVGAARGYTPADAFVRGAPPMRWAGWRAFLAADDAALSRDAQVYLLFQRACMATTAVCALVSGGVLLPAYWVGGAVAARGPREPVSLAALLRSDRGVFERFTSHNLPPHSSLVLLQIPVLAVAASCIVVLHTLVHAATRDHRSLDEWLRAPSTPTSAATTSVPASSASELAAAGASPPRRRLVDSFLGCSPGSPAPPHVSAQSVGGGGLRTGWTLFVRGLPRDIRTRHELHALLDALYPRHVRSVELVCRGRTPEARIVHALTTARNRLDYLLDTPELDTLMLDPEEPAGPGAAVGPGATDAAPPNSWWDRLLLRALGKRPTRDSLIADLTTKIALLQRDLASRKNEPLQRFLGCAFVTVRSPEAAASLVYDFPASSRTGRFALFRRSTVARDGAPGDPAVASRLLPRRGGEAADDGGVERDSSAGLRADDGRWCSADDDSGEGLSFLRLDSLKRAILLLLPDFVRRRLAPPGYFATPSSAGEELAIERLLAGDPVRNAEIRRAATSRLRFMKAERAPKSGDVVWNNVGISFFERTCREVLVQLFVFACLILFTSPVAMLTALRLVFAEVSLLSDIGPTSPVGQNATFAVTTAVPTVMAGGRLALAGFSNSTVARFELSDLNVNDNAAEDISAGLMKLLPSALASNSLLRSILLAYFPVVLLACVFSIVPSLLRAISGLEGYPTYTDREMSVFRKTSFYYLMNAVLLPSLALNTASEFLEMIYKKSDGGANVYNALPILQSLFSGDIAFFLCNYLVQLALTGSVFWLMRLPSSASMMIRRHLAVTPLEAAEAKCTSIFDFPRHFSYSVAVMSMCLLFGFMAPVIWGFAFFYYLCKHAVDTYLIRYVHPRSHIDGRLPRLATTFVLVWTCVAQLAVAVIFYLQGRVRAGFVTAFLCALTLAACVSVGPHLGNRLLGIIPRVRDILIRKFIVGPSDEHSWFAGHNSRISLRKSSSTSSTSSASSGAEGSEEELLLSQSAIRDPRRLSSGLSGNARAGVAQRLDLEDTNTESEIDDADDAVLGNFDLTAASPDESVTGYGTVG